MANYRGMDGSVTIATNTIIETKGWGIDTELEVLNDTVQGDKHETNVGGVGRWSGSFDAQLDYGDTTGQKVAIDRIAIASPPSTPVAAEFITTTTGPKKFTGSILITGYSIRSQTGSIVTVSYKFVGSGQLTPVWT